MRVVQSVDGTIAVIAVDGFELYVCFDRCRVLPDDLLD